MDGRADGLPLTWRRSERGADLAAEEQPGRLRRFPEQPCRWVTSHARSLARIQGGGGRGGGVSFEEGREGGRGAEGEASAAAAAASLISREPSLLLSRMPLAISLCLNGWPLRKGPPLCPQGFPGVCPSAVGKRGASVTCHRLPYVALALSLQDCFQN